MIRDEIEVLVEIPDSNADAGTILKKIGEEATETVLASRERVIDMPTLGRPLRWLRPVSSAKPSRTSASWPRRTTSSPRRRTTICSNSAGDSMRPNSQMSASPSLLIWSLDDGVAVPMPIRSAGRSAAYHDRGAAFEGQMESSSFEPTYIRAMPPSRVWQIHLAGHTDLGDCIIDTHDAAVVDPVWDLYARTVAMLGPVAARAGASARWARPRSRSWNRRPALTRSCSARVSG